MSKLDAALDQWTEGTVTVPGSDGHAEIDVVEVDKLGVKVRGVTVQRETARPLAGEVERLGRDLRALPERVDPYEVDERLGGGVLRTPLDKLRRGRFFEVRVEPQRTDVRRYQVEEGERKATDFTLTREQLEDLVDELEG